MVPSIRYRAFQNELQKGVFVRVREITLSVSPFHVPRCGLMGAYLCLTPTPKQKIEQVKMFGGKYVEVIPTGEILLDDAFNDAKKYGTCHQMSSHSPLMKQRK